MLFRRIFSAIYGKFTMWLISKGIIVIEDKKATTKKDAVGTFSEVASLLSGLPSPKITDSEIDDAENQDSDAVAELAARTRLAEPGRADEDPEDFLVVDANGARFPASALLADIRDGVIDDIAGFRQEGPPKAVTFVSQRSPLWRSSAMLLCLLSRVSPQVAMPKDRSYPRFRCFAWRWSERKRTVASLSASSRTIRSCSSGLRNKTPRGNVMPCTDRSNEQRGSDRSRHRAS